MQNRSNADKLGVLRDTAFGLKSVGCNYNEIETSLIRQAQRLGVDRAIARKIASDFGHRLPEPRQGVRASDVRPTRIQWLWRGYIPRGKVTIIDGDPDKGKSLVTCDISARVSTGRDFPDGSPCTRGRVVLANLDDAADDTILPRLMAADADLKSIIILSTISSSGHEGKRDIALLRLPTHFPELTSLMQEERADALVIDPLLSCLAETTDSYKFQSIATVMLGLKELAEKTSAAVIVVRHLTKASANTPALYRGSGSIGIAGTARQGFIALQHPDNPDAKILAPTKHNLAKNTRSRVYTIEENGEGAPCIRWGDTTKLTANEILMRNESLGSSSDSGNRRKVELLKAVIKCKSEVLNGTLPEKVIRRAFNQEKPENQQVTAQRLGHMLKMLKLGATATTANGAAAITWDQAWIDELCRTYGVQA